MPTSASVGLSDSMSEELGRTHNLGDLNLDQSEPCIRRMRENCHIREKHGGLTGGDCQRLLNETFSIPAGQLAAEGGALGSYSVLRPLLISGCDTTTTAANRRVS